MGTLQQRLAGHQLIGLDTSVFIYHLEAHSTYLPLTKAILNGVQNGQWQAVTSVVTIMALTVHPWRLNRPNIAWQYEAILAHFPNLRLIEIDRDAARRAAQLRAAYNIRPADALQVASALVNQATAWISNDKKLKRLSSIIDTIILDEVTF